MFQIIYLTRIWNAPVFRRSRRKEALISFLQLESPYVDSYGAQGRELSALAVVWIPAL